MSFGFGFSLPGWQTLSGGFSPASLFAAGEQGAWYNPSDLTTLFQDSAGTTPVTAVEQSVGLMLDKSKGLALGSELVTNGTFASGTTGWTAEPGVGVTLSAANNILTVAQTAGTSFGRAYQALAGLTVGAWYQFTVQVASAPTAATAQVWAATTFSGTPGSAVYSQTLATTGSLRLVFQATATTMYIILAANSGTLAVSVGYSNASVKLLAGNHAYQSTSTSRPTLRARYNLLTYSEQFDNAAWGNASTTVSANAGIAPNGTTTADLIYPATTGTFRDKTQQVSAGASAIYTSSVYMKSSGFRWGYLRNLGASAIAAWFDLQNGVTGTIASGYTATIENIGSGWYRCSIASTSAVVTPWCAPGLADADNSSTATANGTSGIFIWGAQVVATNSLTSNAYQRIADAATYDSVGFLPYLAFDGVDDSLLTNSVDFSATDKMTVWAGVRKLSDAARGMLAELSSVATNAGTFYFAAPDLAAPNFGFYLDGGANYQPTTFTSPTTQVVAASFNRSGAALADKIIPRFNGVVNQTNGSDAATTGNFGNYPLYIGRRNNATLPLNGNLYSLIIRGAQSTASQISATETWVNGKTGAY